MKVKGLVGIFPSKTDVNRRELQSKLLEGVSLFQLDHSRSS